MRNCGDNFSDGRRTDERKDGRIHTRTDEGHFYSPLRLRRVTNSVILIPALASFVSGSVKIREMKRQHLNMTDKRGLVGKYTRLFMLFSFYTHFYLHISFQSIVYLSVILLPPAFSKKSGGTLFSAFRSRYAWFRICACYSEFFVTFFAV